MRLALLSHLINIGEAVNAGWDSTLYPCPPECGVEHPMRCTPALWTGGPIQQAISRGDPAAKTSPRSDDALFPSCLGFFPSSASLFVSRVRAYAFSSAPSGSTPLST